MAFPMTVILGELAWVKGFRGTATMVDSMFNYLQVRAVDALKPSTFPRLCETSDSIIFVLLHYLVDEHVL